MNDRGNRSTRRKPAPTPLCPPQIPLDQTRDWTRAAAVGSHNWEHWFLVLPKGQLPSSKCQNLSMTYKDMYRGGKKCQKVKLRCCSILPYTYNMYTNRSGSASHVETALGGSWFYVLLSSHSERLLGLSNPNYLRLFFQAWSWLGLVFICYGDMNAQNLILPPSICLHFVAAGQGNEFATHEL
jgi:hypothetical protein